MCVGRRRCLSVTPLRPLRYSVARKCASCFYVTVLLCVCVIAVVVGGVSSCTNERMDELFAWRDGLVRSML